ncbi:MAG: trypsin-like peptidase domain-containing protein [Oscillospiraceae bacterium]|nr:trypsin-like peptidase domain-containing protein [Oscillospiraceae bacterium]
MNGQNYRPDPWDTDGGAGVYGRDNSPAGRNGEYGYAWTNRPGGCRSDAERPLKNEAAGYLTPRRAAPEPPKHRKKKGAGFAGTVALCLVCALLGGGAGALVTGSILESTVAFNAGNAPMVMAPIPTAPSEQRPINNVKTGDVLSGSELYEMAVDQNVGIKTEITRTNWFGMPTSSAISGSGFIVSSDGYIVTNYHVIEAAYNNGYEVSVITHAGDIYVAAIVGLEKDNDVAVLKIDAEDLHPVVTGNSDEIKVGDSVYAIGNPLGELSFTMTSGMVSALDREIRTESNAEPVNMFQFDAAVNSGNSGGPVYNDRGEVIGIVTAKTAANGSEGLGFAIPINDAARIVNEITEKGYVSGKAAMGITVTDVPESAVMYYNMVPGAYIYTVEPGSCSDRAGLKAGDVITKLGDSEITSRTDLVSAKKLYSAGDNAPITVFRSGDFLTYIIVFDEETPEIRRETEPRTQRPANPFGGFSGQ